MTTGTIVSLRAENVKRLKAVELKPDATGAFVIGGLNGMGKSSCLDAIEFCLGGTAGIDAMPVRKGEENARIVLELDDLIITRKFAENGKSQLVVESKDGDKYSSGQTMLDKLVGDLSFDPFGFTRMKSAEQAQTLRDLVGLDTSKLDESRADQYEYRKDINRQVKQLDGQLKGMSYYPDAATEEVSVTALMTQLEEIRAYNDHCRDMQRQANAAKDAVSNTSKYVEKTLQTVTELEVALVRAKDTHAKAVAQLVADEQTFQELEAIAIEATPKPDSEVVAKIQNADDVNAQVRANRERKDVLDNLKALEAKSEAATAKIEAIDKERTALVTGAAYPIEGLAFSDEGYVTFGGIPFTQCSSAEQLRVSIAIGMSLNPKLKVLLIRDGSLMDQTTLAMVAEMATKFGFQLWIETVGEGESCSVIIEDGAVKSVAPRKRKPVAEAVAT